jgi:alcohol dehydrogenase
MIVIDPGLKDDGFELVETLQEQDLSTLVFLDVEANPRTSTVENLAQLIRQESCDVVVAIGGGSVMDAAKAAAMLAKNPGSPLDYLNTRHFPGGSLPTVMLPTTCGTGSEVTWVSVLTDEANQRKISIKGPQMFPTLALVDAGWLDTLPANLLAWTGMDALTHALEATTCKLANPISDALAEKAISLLLTYLPPAYHHGKKDPHALGQVMKASTLAGMAFGNADVAGVHCLSESLGALYDTPHGLANAVLLLPVLESHMPYVNDRLQALATLFHAVEVSDAEGFLAQIQALNDQLQIPTFSSLNVPKSDFDKIAALATSNGSNASNPRIMGESDYRQILNSLS